MPEPHSHSSTLFITQDGAPMRFYIRPGPRKRQLAPLITHGGGEMCRIQEPGAFLLADPSEGQLGPGYISTAYITDSVRSNRSLSPRPYRLIPFRDLKTRRDQMRSPASKLTAVHGAPGTKDHTERPTNNVETTVQGLKENPTTTVTTTEGAPDEREDNMKKGNNTPTKACGIEKGHGRTSTASRRSIFSKASSVEYMKPVEGAASSTDGTCMKEITADERDHKNAGETAAATSTSSEVQKNLSSTKMDVEETLNEVFNYSMLVIPDPRSSTPAPGNHNTVKVLETDTAHVSTLKKDGDCLEFMRPKRKVAGRLSLRIGEMLHSPKPRRAKEQTDQHSPNPKKKRAEEQTDQHSPNLKQRRAEEQTDQHSPNPKQKRTEEQTDQRSPNLKQKRAEEQTDQYSPIPKQNVTEKTGTYKKAKNETQMTVLGEHCGQDVQGSPIGEAQVSNLEGCDNQDQSEDQPTTAESHCAESQAGQFAHTETGAQKLDVQSAESHQVQSGFSLPSSKASAALRRGRMAYTEEEDIAILLYVRDNVSSSRTVTGNTLWVEMEKKRVLNRTWQAMKSRYVKYLTYQKHKYKLPPKITSLPSKEKMQGSPKSCTSDSAVAPQNCNVPLHSPPVNIPQNFDAIIPSTSAASPKKVGSVLPSTSTVTLQQEDTMPPTVFVGTPEKGSAMLPIASADSLQKNEAMLSIASTDDPQISDATLPKVSSDNAQDQNPVFLCASTKSPQKRDAVLSSVSTNRAQKRNILLHSASPRISQKPDAMLPSDSSSCAEKNTKLHRASSEGPLKHATLLPIASTDDPQKSAIVLPIVSTDGPQIHINILPIASMDDPQKFATVLPCASTDDPQKHATVLPSASMDDPQKSATVLPSASTDDPQKHTTMLHSVPMDDPQKSATVLPSASTADPQKCDAVLHIASTNELQKSAIMLPGSSGDNHQSSTIKQHGASHSADTLVPNIASKEQTTLKPKKRSSNPSKDDESSPQKKGNRMLPPSDNTPLPDQEDSGDSEGLNIFERANMEFEETDENSSPDQPISQTEAVNTKSASHVDETPPTSQAPEGEGLQKAMMDMMKEFQINVSQATQALFFNSGELGSTRHFLRTGARPDGYPIWEPKDDLDLKKNNLKLPSHLIRKYGADNVARRAAFLAS